MGAVKLKKACLAVALLFVLYTARAAETDAEFDATGSTEAQAEVEARAKQPIESFFSLDLGWFLHGLSNNGIALGVNYEHIIVPHFSLRGTAGFMLFGVSALDAYAADVSISLYASWYPLSNTLDKLYVGVGASTDFVCYFGSDSLPDPAEDVLIAVTPIVGWKQNIANVVALDFYGGYSFIVFNSQRFHGTEEYIRSGIQLGIRFKILWRPRRSRADS